MLGKVDAWWLAETWDRALFGEVVVLLPKMP